MKPFSPKKQLCFRQILTICVFCFRTASKQNIKDAIERHFNVKVTHVNTMNAKPKSKRDRTRRNKLGYTAAIKKAVVSLKAGDSIDLA